jgi:hypothetical protein
VSELASSPVRHSSAGVLDLPGVTEESWQEEAYRRGWGDGLPLVAPTPARVAAALAALDGIDLELGPLPPSGLVPTRESLAANAVMAGCRPEYFPVVLAALRGVLAPEYNLHGTLATTHSCAPMLLVNGPLRHALGINCGSNCFGQGWRANAAIGRALGLILLNVGGGKPAVMDRSTFGSPAKYSFCFGENQEESPWAPYHVRRGFDAEDSVVTVMSAEPNHNLNDHGSTTGEGLLTTFAGAIASPAANTVYGKGPYFVAFGPEHAATLGRDGWTVEAIQQFLYDRARVPVSQVSRENQAIYEESGHTPQDGFYKVAPTPQDIHVLVAGGPGKHSAWIPSFGGTAAVSVRVKPPG